MRLSLCRFDKKPKQRRVNTKFYKDAYKDTYNPITWSHFNAEGDVDFTWIIFVSERSSEDQFRPKEVESIATC